MRGTVLAVYMAVIASVGVGLLAGCSENTFVGEPHGNKPPEVWLSSGPVEKDTTGYRVHFYWSGWDPDGEIDHFEFVIADGDPFGFDPDDTTGIEKWTRTDSYDSTFKVTADELVGAYEENELYTRYEKTHTFFLRAVDLEGMGSRAATRSFTAWTLAPTITIDRPRLQSSSIQAYSSKITFGWTGRDPIDAVANVQDPDSIRYLVWSIKVPFDWPVSKPYWIVDDLNQNPWRFEDSWSKWISYSAPNDSGRVTIIGDDEILEPSQYIFAMQAMDEAGAVTAIFRLNDNVRVFYVSKKVNPILNVQEPFLGAFKFAGMSLIDVQKDLPPGVPLKFSWHANAEDYGGEIVGYRWGWNVKDLNDPDDWPVPFSIFNTVTRKKLYSGIHDFSVEVIDNGGRITRGQISITIIPFTMERNLLWIDDFQGAENQPPNYMIPSEQNHDAFWTGICGRSRDFIVERDVYDTMDNNRKPPEMNLVGRYKNIIWCYTPGSSAWSDVVSFVPESMIGQATKLSLNYLAIFLAKGGHLWTCGRSELRGGLAAIFPTSPTFPASFKFEMNTHVSWDTSGVNSMGYKDHCVSVLDKVWGSFKSGPDIPLRSINRDGLRLAIRDDDDPVSDLHDGIPRKLELWDEVTSPGRFFDPSKQGFHYVELYDPEYWMEKQGITSQGCFRPLYRMSARNTNSPVHNATAVFWTTKHDTIIPEVTNGVAVAAPSIHFGFPLWFFDHESVDSIATVIFSEWGILDE